MRAQIRARPNSIKPTISVILIDWSVRESFHSLRYLNEQTFPRERTELIWVECYKHYPDALHRSIKDPSHPAPLDQWIVLERSGDTHFHKHELYNAGILAAQGELCIICDSDAIFAKTFLYSVYLAMKSASRRVVHVDEVRSGSRAFYPFNNPTVDGFLRAPGLMNWTGNTTTGLAATHDRLHELNYGACMCAARRDLVAIGGADEHIDYLGYICGPHEMTFRLVNNGHREHWLQDEWIYHAWHPGQSGARSYGGPHDGRNFSTRTLALQQNQRAQPWVENPAIRMLREGATRSSTELLEELGALDRREWREPEKSLMAVDPVELVESVNGYNILRVGQMFVALAQSEGAFSREKLAAGEFSDAFVATSIDTARREIQKGRSSEAHVSRVALPGHPGARQETPAFVSTVNPPPVKAVKSQPSSVRTSRIERRRKRAARRLDRRTARARLLLRSRLAADLGWACYRKKRSQRALRAFDEAVEADTDNVSARRGRATVRVAVGRIADSLADFRVAINHLSSDRTMRAKVLIERGWARYYLSESEEAVRDFSSAVEDATHTKSKIPADLFKARCWALADTRQWREAMHDFKRYQQMRGHTLATSPFVRLIQLRLSVFEGRLRRFKRRVQARISALRSDDRDRWVTAAARVSR
jgi:Tfp pilus assembly protein PilF